MKMKKLIGMTINLVMTIMDIFYGIHYIRDEEIEEVEWFKSKAKRDKDFNECIKLGYKPIN